MDFKVGGTREGVTALQLDIKVGGIPVDILKESLRGAKVAREHILDTIEATIAKPRTDISPYAPKIVVMKIAVDQIGLVIGGGGKTIKDIREKTGAEITIEDDGTVYITGKDGAAEKAQVIIAAMTKEWKIGDMTTGEVVKIIDAGAIVKLSEYTDGFIHISEIAPFRVAQVRDLLKEGMHVPVKVVAIDKERDRISLSLKDADKDFFKPADAPKSHQ